MTMKKVLGLSLLFSVGLCGGAAAQSVCATVSGGTVIGGPFPRSATNDCSQYPAGMVLINTANTGDPNYAAWQTFAAAQAALGKQAAAQAAVANAAAAGITLSCTTYTTLSGTFAVTPRALISLDSMRTLYKINGVAFPVAIAVPTILDTSNKPHTVPSLAALTALGNILTGYSLALSNYLNAVYNGQSPTLPAATSSAC
jgi:hypothetical protein